MLAMRSPEMKKAVGVLKKLSASEQTRMLYEQHEMVLRDIESMKDDAFRESEEKWQGIVAEKEAAHAAAIAIKDAALADKDAENKHLRELIAALQAQRT